MDMTLMGWTTINTMDLGAKDLVEVSSLVMLRIGRHLMDNHRFIQVHLRIHDTTARRGHITMKRITLEHHQEDFIHPQEMDRRIILEHHQEDFIHPQEMDRRIILEHHQEDSIHPQEMDRRIIPEHHQGDSIHLQEMDQRNGGDHPSHHQKDMHRDQIVDDQEVFQIQADEVADTREVVNHHVSQDHLEEMTHTLHMDHTQYHDHEQDFRSNRI